MSGGRDEGEAAKGLRRLILVVKNGPNWFPEPSLRYRAAAFSQLGETEIWTFGNPARFQEGRTRVVALGTNPGRFQRQRFIVRFLLRCCWLRWVRWRRLIIITSDPLGSGLLAMLVKSLCGARFVCEVNGVHLNPDTYLDYPDPERRTRKLKRVGVIGSCVLRRADHIRLLYPGQLEGFRGTEGVPRSVLFELYSAEDFEGTALGHEKILLFVGFPYFLKGVDILLEAFGRARKEDPEWRLVMVGFALREPALESGIPLDGVEFVGPKPREEVVAWMVRCQGLVLPSRSEAMGRVLLEVGRVGRARIGSTAYGIPHYIEDGEDGLLFESGDARSLEQVLRRFFRDRALRERLGVSARRRVEREYKVSDYVAGYRKILESVDR